MSLPDRPEQHDRVSAPLSENRRRFGCLAGIDDSGRLLIVVDGSSKPQVALTTVRMSRDEFRESVGERVVIDFDGGKPIVTGIIQTKATLALREVLEIAAPIERPSNVIVDNQAQHIIEAQEELTLKCGKASITLRKNGKVIIRGVDVLTDADGCNRIRGGVVDIN